MTKANRTGFLLGAIFAGIGILCAQSAPDIQTSVAHSEVIFNDTNSVSVTTRDARVKAIGYTFDVAEAATNSLSIIVTRVNTLVDRDNGTNAPAVLTWTNTHTIATILTTNTASALHTGSISDTLYLHRGDMLTYTNTVVEDGLLTVDWQY